MQCYFRCAAPLSDQLASVEHDETPCLLVDDAIFIQLLFLLKLSH